MKLNLPNCVTLIRIAGTPLIMVTLLLHFSHHYQVSAGLFLVFMASDMADGQIARRLHLVTELGKFLDPLADKLLLLAVLVALVQDNLVAAWIAVVILAREILITLLRAITATQGRVMAANRWGKTKTVVQIAAVLLLILQAPYPVLATPALAVVLVAVGLTLYSGAYYIWLWSDALLRPSPRGGASRYELVWPLSGGAPGGDEDLESLAAKVCARLADRGLRVAVAESCTGGLLGACITAVPGSSKVFRGGIIAYDDAVKSRILAVAEPTLAIHGAVSPQTAQEMAVGSRRLLETELGIGITGIAGPGGATDDKPVGLVYLALCDERDHTRVMELRLPGGRHAVRTQATSAALQMLLDHLGSGAAAQAQTPSPPE